MRLAIGLMNKPGRWLVCGARPTSRVSADGVTRNPVVFERIAQRGKIAQIWATSSQCRPKTKKLMHRPQIYIERRVASNVALGTQAL